MRLQLCQRPFNRDCKRPNCNEDFISPMFRDYLMPARCVLAPPAPCETCMPCVASGLDTGACHACASADAACSAWQVFANTEH